MDVVGWLLAGDPAVRWQVMAHLLDAPAHEVEAERARVTEEGWGRRLLVAQGGDGVWGRGLYSPKWTSTTYTLLLLRLLGADPVAPRMSEALERVETGPAWASGARFFQYLGETCVTSMVLALASYFRPGDGAEEAVEWLLGQQLGDGGWNCQAPKRSGRSSFNTTILALEALWEYGQAVGDVPKLAAARRRGEEYLLARRLMRSLSTGEIISPSWRLFSFPPQWHYDVLRGLEHLCRSGAEPDPRCEEAVALVETKRRKDGTWTRQHRHAGLEHFEMEAPGQSSRWNTLRALGVLAWYRSPAVRSA